MTSGTSMGTFTVQNGDCLKGIERAVVTLSDDTVAILTHTNTSITVKRRSGTQRQTHVADIISFSPTNFGTTGDDDFDYPIASMAADENDNIYIVTGGDDGQAYYSRYNRSGASWVNVTPNQQINGTDASEKILKVDIAPIGTAGCVAVSMLRTVMSSPGHASHRVYTRSTGGSWSQHLGEATTIDGGTITAIWDSFGWTSIAAAGGTSTSRAVMACWSAGSEAKLTGETNLAYGASLAYMTVNTTSGDVESFEWVSRDLFNSTNYRFGAGMVAWAGVGEKFRFIGAVTHFHPPVVQEITAAGDNLLALALDGASVVGRASLALDAYFGTTATAAYYRGNDSDILTLIGFNHRDGGYTFSGWACDFADETAPVFLSKYPIVGFGDTKGQPLAIRCASATAQDQPRLDMVWGKATATNTSTLRALCNVTPATPTIASPADAATVDTDVPTLEVQINPSDPMRLPQTLDVAVARNGAMSDSFRQLSGVPTTRKALGIIRTTVPGTQALDQQSDWFIQARTTDIFGNTSGSLTAASTHNITVAHVPSTDNHAPKNGQEITFGLGATAVQWTFEDTSSVDTQSAFQVQIEQVTPSLLIIDSGKVMSSSLSYRFEIPEANQDKDIRWRVRVWDSDDVVSAYSDWFTFNYGAAPVVGITSPTPSQVLTSAVPTVSWTFTVDAAGQTQSFYRVAITRTSDDRVTYDTGWVASTSTSHPIPSGALEDDTSYTVEVSARDSIASLIRADTHAFSTNLSQPAAVGSQAVDISDYAELGYVDITWAAAANPTYRVYRRNVDTDLVEPQLWQLVGETTALTLRDWYAPSNQDLEYVVVQVDGSSRESHRTPVISVTPQTTFHWLVHPTDDTKTLNFRNVTAETFSVDREREVMQVLGGGRRVEVGDRIGYSGELTVQIKPDGYLNRTAREIRLMLEDLADENIAMHYRNPFGDVFEVDMGALSFDRVAGRGFSEDVDVSIPFYEVVST